MRNASPPRFRPGVEILEGREVPAFLSPIASSGGGSWVAAGDVNHDGRDDVAVLANTNVKVSLSNGDGTFRQAGNLTGAKGYYPHPIRMVDANNDGHLDVELDLASQKYTYVSTPVNSYYEYTTFRNLWLGRGDGTFGRVSTTRFEGATYLPPWFYSPPTAVIVDVNRDGLADNVRLNSAAGGIDVELRNPDGSYQPPRGFAAAPNPGTLAVGDFNGDGWADIVVVNNSASNQLTLFVLFNDPVW